MAISFTRAWTNVVRLTVFALFIIVSQSALSQPKNNDSKDVKAILDVMQQEIDYWNAGNIEGYVSLYAPEDSVRMLFSGGSAYGRDSILAFYKKYWPKERMGQLSFSDIRIEKLSDIYYFTSGMFHVKFPDGKGVNGRFSALMKKINGRWYLYTDHSG